jgi:glucokinase
LAVIGIDVGGSKTAGILWDEGQMQAGYWQATDRTSSDAVLRGLVDTCLGLLTEADERGLEVSAVGLGIAGFIDFDRGIVTQSPNLPLNDFPVRDLLMSATGKRIFVDNDANVAALAEARLGAGKGVRYLIHLTLGTGIGGGIVLDGKLYRGASGSAAEFGFMIVSEGGPESNAGFPGCLEALSSGTAIHKRVEELAAKGEKSPMVSDFLKDPEAFSADDVCKYADVHDGSAIEILRDAGKHLGSGIASLVNIFNPDVVTLSGGLLDCFQYMEADMRRVFEESTVPISREHTRILTTTLGEHGGQLGAAILALESG